MASELSKHKYLELPVPPQQTLLLSQIQNDNRCCPHHHRTIYPSPSDYISHALWIIYGTQYHLKHCRAEINGYFLQQLEMNRSILFACICTNCCNSLLSTFSILDIDASSSDALKEIIVLNLFMHHPRMARLAVKECPITKSLYLSETINAGNNIIASIAETSILCIDHRRNKHTVSIHIIMVYSSMRYWNEYYYLFFVKRFMVRFREALLRVCVVELELQQEQDEGYCVVDAMAGIIGRIWDRYSKRLGVLSSVLNDSATFQWMRMTVEPVGNKWKTIDLHKLIKENMTCCWSRCLREEKDIDGAMKMCSGCKMTYYCSRRCQKKAWKHDHKDICKKLRERYNL